MEMSTQARTDGASRIPEAKFRESWRILLSHKWIVVLGLIIVLTATFLYLRWTTPVYQAETVLMFKRENNPAISLLVGIQRRSIGPVLDDQRELLKSSSILGEIADQMAAEGLSVSTGELGNSISLESRSASVFAIAATADNPTEAMVLANMTADVYMSRMSELRSTDLDQAESFLSEQMKVVDGKLREAEEALNAFREREGIVGSYKEEGSSGLLGQLGDLYAESSKTQNDRELAQAKFMATRQLLDEKKKEVASLGSIRLASQIESLQSLISNWQVELVKLRRTLTDKSREVVDLNEKIADAQTQLDSYFQELKQHGVSIDPLSEWQSLVQESVQLEIQLRGLQQNENTLKARIAKFKADHPQLISKEVELTRLGRTSRIHEQTYMLLMDKYEETRLLKQMKAAGTTIIDRATAPGSPVKPNKRLVITLGILMGLITGVGAAFFLEYMDDSLRIEKDIERFLDLSVVGAIPMIKAEKATLKAIKDKGMTTGNMPALGQGTNSDAHSSSQQPINESAEGLSPVKKSKRSKRHQKSLSDLMARTITNLDPKSPVAESYRSLWTNIQFANVDKEVKTILISSSGPHEGKTLTVANLAITMARMGAKILAVDADMRRPRLHNIFRQQKEPGLSDFLVSGNGVDAQSHPEDREQQVSDNGDILSTLSGFVRKTEVENLYLLPSGKRPPNPAELLNSHRKRELVEKLKQEFDMILFDSPPIVPVTDATVLASEMADIILLVVRSGETKREVAQKAQELLERVDTNVFGVVLNTIDYAKRYGSYYYYYYYHYYYSHDDEEE